MTIGNFRILGAKSVPSLLDKINRTDIVDDLVSGGTGAPLSAEKGKALKVLIDTEAGSRVSGDLAIIGTATAAFNTLGKAEAVVAANKTAADTAITDLQNTVNNTITTAITALESADTALGVRIDAEIADRQAAISNEAATRTAAIDSVSATIAQEVIDRQTAVSNLSASVTAADTVLQTNIDAEVAARTLAVATEVSAREAAVATVDSKIDAEVTARIAAVAGVQTALNAEVANRTTADGAHDLRLSALETGYAVGAKFKGAVANLAEFDAFVEAEMEAGWTYIVDSGSTGSTDVYVVLMDNSGEYQPVGWTTKSVKWMMDASDVTNAVSTERTQRQSADTQLQNNINTLDAKVDGNKTLADASIATLRGDMKVADAAEATARSNGDAALQVAIDAEVTNRQTAVAAVQANLDAETLARESAVSSEASSRISADTALQANLDAEIAARTAAVTAESDARIAGDAAQTTALNTEVAARQAADTAEADARTAADTALSGRLDVIEGDELVAGSVRNALLDAKKHADLYIPMPQLEGADGTLLVVGNTVSLTYAPHRGLNGVDMGEVVAYAPDGQSLMVSVSNVVGNVLTLSESTVNEYDGWQVKVRYWFINADQGGSGVGVAGEGGAGA